MPPAWGRPTTEECKLSEATSEKLAGGLVWQGLAGALVRVLRILVFLALARLIAPEAFGTVAIAAVVAAVAWTLAGFGLIQALIHAPVLQPRHINVVFWTSLWFGLAAAATQLLLAFPLASAFHLRDLGPVIAALAAAPLIVALSTVPEGLLSRNMLFKNLAARHLVATTASSLLALALAVAGGGVWALVLQTLSESVLSAGMLWFGVRSLRIRITRPAVRGSGAFLGYGGRLTAANFAQLVSTQADNVLIGIFQGAAAVGLYSVAYRLLTTLQEIFLGSIGSVILPTLASHNRDAVRRQGIVGRVIAGTLATGGFVFAFVAGAPATVIDLSLGIQWRAAGPIVFWLALAGIAACVNSSYSTAMSAYGRTSLLVRLNLIVTVVHVSAFTAAALRGPEVVAFAYAAINVLQIPVTAVLFKRQIPNEVIGGALASRVGIVLLVPFLAGVLVERVTRNGAWLIQIGLTGLLFVVAAVLVLFLLRFVARATFTDLLTVLSRLSPRGRR